MLVDMDRKPELRPPKLKFQKLRQLEPHEHENNYNKYFKVDKTEFKNSPDPDRACRNFIQTKIVKELEDLSTVMRQMGLYYTASFQNALE